MSSVTNITSERAGNGSVRTIYYENGSRQQNFFNSSGQLIGAIKYEADGSNRQLVQPLRMDGSTPLYVKG